MPWRLAPRSCSLHDRIGIGAGRRLERVLHDVASEPNELARRHELAIHGTQAPGLEAEYLARHRLSPKISDRHIRCTQRQAAAWALSECRALLRRRIVTYVGSNGQRVAQVHEYKKPDGSRGASGLPDPKRLIVNNELWIVDPSDNSP